MELLPKLSRILEEMGANIKLAQLRRKLTAKQVAEMAGISRSTLIKNHLFQSRLFKIRRTSNCYAGK
ncbi:MAG: hypothetical protein LBJ17_01090 [Dysgonamonadaceae bacterium]|jgi:hypothetical protein|nr:hypothetical protein [Dysgonamonadaceae bacterium]